MADPPLGEFSQSLLLRLLRRALPLLMLLMLLGGIVGGIRLTLALGQPFPGVSLMWRKELKLLAVGWATPSDWPGLGPDKLQVNDRILCIGGYQPSPDSVVYGLDPRYTSITCPNGGKDYLSFFRERLDSTRPVALEFLVDRSGDFITVSSVPLI